MAKGSQPHSTDEGPHHRVHVVGYQECWKALRRIKLPGPRLRGPRPSAAMDSPEMLPCLILQGGKPTLSRHRPMLLVTASRTEPARPTHR